MAKNQGADYKIFRILPGLAAPGGPQLIGRVGCKRVRLAAIGVHDINLEIPIPLGLEDDLLAIRRPGWVLIESGIIRELAEIAAISVHHKNIRVARAGRQPIESNLLAIRRPGREQFPIGLVARACGLRPSAFMMKISTPGY